MNSSNITFPWMTFIIYVKGRESLTGNFNLRNLYDLHVALELCHQNYQRQFLNTEVPDRSRCHTPKMPDNTEFSWSYIGWSRLTSRSYQAGAACCCCRWDPSPRWQSFERATLALLRHRKPIQGVDSLKVTIHYTQLIHVCMFWSIIRHLCAKHIGQDGGVMMKINRQHPPLTYWPERFSRVASTSQTKLFWITLNKYFWIRNRGYQDQCKRITCCKHHWGRLPGCQGKIEDVGDLRKYEYD